MRFHSGTCLSRVDISSWPEQQPRVLCPNHWEGGKPRAVNRDSTPSTFNQYQLQEGFRSSAPSTNEYYARGAVLELGNLVGRSVRGGVFSAPFGRACRLQTNSAATREVVRGRGVGPTGAVLLSFFSLLDGPRGPP